MAAPKGNSYWKSRSKHGRDKLFSSPELLLESAMDYFDWCDENPWKKTKKVTKPQGITTEEEPTQRPYSKTGWFHFIKCSDTWLTEFKKTADKDFLRVIEEVENFISTQQFEGATVGAFNANIIARTLGLADKQEVKTDQPNIVVSLRTKKGKKK